MRYLHWLVVSVLLALLAVTGAARADTAIALSKTFDGRVNFTGTQLSLRTRSNSNGACSVSSSSANRTAVLTLPAGATVLSAQLYWAGSGVADSTVTFEGKSVTATRKYSSSTVGGGLNYFGGALDVTSVVKAKGSGTYTFSGLTVSIGNPWCYSQAVLGGFSLLVVYSHPSEPERVLNLYEGFRYVQNSEVIVTASNFRWNRTFTPVREKARIGHITWEGDPTLSQDGERLLFEGSEVSDALNPEGNQFNSRSNINNDSASYGVDFDAYDTTVLIWAFRDARVTTSYRTGQDLVLLNAEILLVPTMPVSDLSVALARSGVMQSGKNTTYTATLTNNGPYTEAGPVTLSASLPAGVGYVSASGSGWTCSAAAATTSGEALTCIYKGALAADTSAAPLVITASVTSTGQKITTVTVKGTDDDDLTNNAASDTSTAAAADVVPTPPAPPASGSYVFTDRECAVGVKIAAGTTSCQYFAAALPVTAGKGAAVYITYLGADGVPAVPAAAPKLKFALRCVNPAKTAGVQAILSGASTLALPACADAEPVAVAAASWSNEISVPFPSAKASVAWSLGYLDVGSVELSLMQGSAPGAQTARFVFRPDALGFRRISANDVTAPTGVDAIKPEGLAFAMAGEELLFQVGARMVNPAGTGILWAPNFGNELQRPAVALATEALYANVGDALFLPKAPAPSIDADSWSAGGGSISVNASWDETGATTFVASLADYLATGPVDPARQDVGRFYPAYFSTEVEAPYPCLSGVKCPIVDEVPLGVAYSKQPFTVKLVPRNMKDEPVANYTGKWIRASVLSAVDDPGENGKVLDGLKAATLAAGQSSGKPRYELAVPFVSTAMRANAWTRPVTLYVRANSDDERVTKEGKAKITVSSNRAPAAPDEDGLVIVNGRLKVANTLGSDLLPTLVPLRVEYWPDAGEWLGHGAYLEAAGVGGAMASFLTCKGDLATAGPVDKPPPCNTTLVAASAAPLVTLKGGAGVLRLKPIGRPAGGKARTGSINLLFPGWDWLPSTLGRVSFGSYRSPVIYVREMYF